MTMTAFWNDKLITRSRAADMCGTWQVTIDNQGNGMTFLRCLLCDGNITRLPGAGMTTSVDQVIAVVLRHMCSSHEYKLSGAGNEDNRGDSPAADGAGHRGGSRRVADPVR